MLATATETKTARRKRLRAELLATQTSLKMYEIARIWGAALTVACSPNWATAIKDAVIDGVIPHEVDKFGRLKTRTSDLLIAAEMAGVYPQAADDRPDGNGHAGSQRQPCLSGGDRGCTQHYISDDDTTEPRSILYPPTYLRGGCLCETCYVNKTRLDELAEELGFTRSALMSPSSMGIRGAEYYGRRIKHRRTKQGKFPRLK